MAQFNPIYFITSASYSGGKLNLVVNGTPTIANRSQFVLRFAPSIAVPSGMSSTASVWLTIGTTQIQVKDKFGMPAEAGSLPLNSSQGFFNPRYAIVGGIGSSTSTATSTSDSQTTTTPTTTYWFSSFNLPILCYMMPL
jgi:hypothetical protein